MAKSLENKPNTGAPDSTWPYGDLKDETQSQSGTPVNKEVYEDIHQFFMKLMDEAGISFNEMFDNADNGFQFWEALVTVAVDVLSGGTQNINFDNLYQLQVFTGGRNGYITVNDSNGYGELTTIRDGSHSEFDSLVVVFSDQVDLKQNAHGNGGELVFSSNSNPSDLTVTTGYPYVFRLIGGKWYLESGFDYLSNTKANREQEAWTDVTTFGSSWGSATTGSGYDVGYRKDEFGNVELRGLIDSGGSSSGTVAFELPGGYIPAATIYQPAVEGNTPNAAVQVDSNGNVSVWYSGSGNVYLDSVRFEAHQ